MRILGIIPSRFASIRFPGKALVDIRGKSMVSRVYEQAAKAQHLDQVLVATDHEKIFQHLTELGIPVCMTARNHRSGTERCYEALNLQPKSYDFVINIQGDEPFIYPQQIDNLAQALTIDTNIATMVKRIHDQQELIDPNTVKAVIGEDRQALYFSRSPLPYKRNQPMNTWIKHHTYYKHLGIYAYSSVALKKITSLPESDLEIAEGLEQLRWLAHGLKVETVVTKLESFGIDTPEDLELALASKPDLE
ncbi:MAG: 3-deoxy-manno-octulosonate cytidylyltransferase [Cyclobacteriaceae bacterium]